MGILGGLLGGGGGGGAGGGVGLNAIIGSLAGGLAADREAKLKSQSRQRLRKATNQAEGQTASEVLSILNSPVFQGAQDFLGGLFGLQGGSGLPGSQIEGTFAGGIESGGDIFFGTPGRFGIGKGTLKRGKKLGKQIAQGLQAQQLLNSGQQFKNKRLRRLNNQLTRGQSALSRLQASPNLRTGAARSIRTRGFELEQADTLAPQAVSGTQPIPEMPGAPSAADRVGGFAQPTAALPGTAGDTGLFDPLTNNINKQLRQTLARQGFNTSLAGAATEALGTGLARTQLQLQALPQLLGLGQTGFNLRQQALPTNLNLAIGRSGLPIGLGPDPFAASIQGGLAGQGIQGA